MVRDMAREFAASRLAPNAAAWDREARVPREVVAEMGDLGLLAEPGRQSLEILQVARLRDSTLLAGLATEDARELEHFSFRGMSPLLDTAPFTIHRTASEDGASLWAAGPDGGLAMTAEAIYRS